jgi:hypothetical protein
VITLRFYVERFCVKWFFVRCCYLGRAFDAHTCSPGSRFYAGASALPVLMARPMRLFLTRRNFFDRRGTFLVLVVLVLVVLTMFALGACWSLTCVLLIVTLLVENFEIKSNEHIRGEAKNVETARRGTGLRFRRAERVSTFSEHRLAWLVDRAKRCSEKVLTRSAPCIDSCALCIGFIKRYLVLCEAIGPDGSSTPRRLIEKRSASLSKSQRCRRSGARAGVTWSAASVATSAAGAEDVAAKQQAEVG